MRVFNNWKIIRSYTEEIDTYQPEILISSQKFYAELWKTNGTDYESACLKVMMSLLDR